MASNRRKQEEKHLKILRELGANPSNRTCFDCHQKGPTYINMTIGSFVCTSCSGILRGLNPPHRVKSISMASFSPEEIEQIKSKGNHFCQAVWLGLYDGKSSLFPDTKDEHKIRDFMISKYEKKRFYIDPSVAVKTLNTNANSKSGSSSNASTPGSSDSRSLGSANQASNSNTSTSVSRPVVSLPTVVSSPCLNGLAQTSVLKPSSSVDLLSSLGGSSKGETGDKIIFNSQQGGFANFDNANIFTNSTEEFYSLPNPSLSPPSDVPKHLSSKLISLSDPSHFSSDENKIVASMGLTSTSSCLTEDSFPPLMQSDDINSWEDLEDNLSAAMPLIPTGELPPTYHSGTSKAGSGLVFASGVSVQTLTSPSSKQLSSFQEGRAASLPSSLLTLYIKDAQRDKGIRIHGQAEKCIELESPKMNPHTDDYFRDDDDPLASGIPLLSLESPSRSLENSFLKHNRYLSLPLGINSINENLAIDENLANSSICMKQQPEAPSFEKASVKIAAPDRRAISKKTRARLMLDNFSLCPLPILSSSLPENSHFESNALKANTDLVLENPYAFNIELPSVDAVTVTSKKTARVSNASDFTNAGSAIFGKITSTHSVTMQPFSLHDSVVKETCFHLSDNNDYCISSALTNTTTVDYPFIAGSSMSKVNPISPPPFSSNPLTPISSSSLAGGITTQVSHDRYAALKDLDEAFKTQMESEKTPPNSGGGALFGSPPRGSGSHFAGAVSNGPTASPNGGVGTIFGSSPGSGGGTGGALFPSTASPPAAWTTSGINPFSGNPNSNTPSPWVSNCGFGATSHFQANPFAGAIDPNFNGHFGIGVNGTSPSQNANWANFARQPPTVPSGNVAPPKISPSWSSTATQNPFTSQVPLSGHSYNPFL